MTIAFVVLAGGRGTRLGGLDKARLLVGGHTLLERVLARMPSPDPALIALGSRSDRHGEIPVGAIRIHDAEGEAGPLAGLLSACRWLARYRPDCMLVQCAPVDSPFLPRDLSSRLAEALPEGCPAIFPKARGQVAWAHGLWRVPALVAATAALPSPLPGPKGLAGTIGATELAWPADDDHDPFAGINTVTDLLAATRKLARHNTARVAKTGLGKADQTG